MMEIWPLDSVREVSEWRADSSATWRTATVPLWSPRSSRPSDRPRTLVCHDLKGGYLQDRFVQGSSAKEVYSFAHWSLVDAFVYFSHHLVTIPPPSWIDSAHLHNVPVLGTLITEWEAGTKACSEILASDESREAFVDRLVQISVHYRFDGWLVNIENLIEEGLVDGMVSLVKSLTDKMHSSVPGSLVIWYDSVTCRGDLTWQNELNSSNRCFFDVCDGIFLNYTWTLDNLERSADVAGDRKLDVYVGIDVFGRGSYGGGGFNSSLAMKAIRDRNLSAAIFAPSWTWECLPVQDFIDNDYRFWGYLSKFCIESPVPSTLPFATSFCQGLGNHVFRRGHPISSGPWSNLSLQQVQPSFLVDSYREGLPYSLSPYRKDAYDGGGCLRILGSDRVAKVPALRLWKCEWKTEGRQRALVSLTWKSKKPREDARIALIVKAVRREGGLPATLMLVCEDEMEVPTEMTEVPNAQIVYPIDRETRDRLTSRGVHVPESPEDGWQTKLFVLPPGITITEMLVEVLSESNDGFHILIGQIKVALLSKLKKPSHNRLIRVECIETEDDHRLIRWRCDRNGHHDAIFDVFCGADRYLGSTRRRCYRLQTNADAHSQILFTVQQRPLWLSGSTKGTTTSCANLSASSGGHFSTHFTGID